ncbi:hypothetical protein [uncultured Rikenella sp.]|uniref:hypothetical protein n=1 Tax=uncultured Rikenella sp. TaxID=368003 RepID=UPI00272C6E4A|nr:hypothetical protein [uncultured Rikenella sp.]
MNRVRRAKKKLRAKKGQPVQNPVARPPKEGFRSFCGEQNRDEIPAGDEKKTRATPKGAIQLFRR